MFLSLFVQLIGTIEIKRFTTRLYWSWVEWVQPSRGEFILCLFKTVRLIRLVHWSLFGAFYFGGNGSKTDTHRQTDRQTDSRQTDRQTDTHTHTHDQQASSLTTCCHSSHMSQRGTPWPADNWDLLLSYSSFFLENPEVGIIGTFVQLQMEGNWK